MLKFWFSVYNAICIPALWLLFHSYGLINLKVRRGLSGRAHVFRELNNFLKNINNEKKSIIIHSSSLGEYQQSLPLVEEFHKLNYNIIHTFFSPSGYENSKIPYQNSLKIYLPFDSIFKVKKFLDAINPEYIILIRYDLWFNFLYSARRKNIKTILANARYDEKDIFWKLPVASSFKKNLYRMIDKIFVIDEEDGINYKKKLNSLNSEIIRVGDSKFERVFQASQEIAKNNFINEEILKGRKVFVIGSSWKEDEEVVLPVVNKSIEFERDILTFLVPHEPKETKIAIIEKNIKSKYRNLKSLRLSDISNYNGENLIIVDCIGKLINLYSIAYMSYVGGGFRSGLHNVLEPAVFNIPVFFANDVKNSDEDEILLKSGGGILVKDQKHFYKDFRDIMSNPSLREKIGRRNKKVFENTLGTTKKIVNHISNN